MRSDHRGAPGLRGGDNLYRHSIDQNRTDRDVGGFGQELVRVGVECLHVQVGAEHEPRLDSELFRDRRHRKCGDPGQGRRRGKSVGSTALTPSSDRLRGVGRCWLRKPTGAEKERRRYCEVPQNCLVHTSDHHAVDEALPASSRKTESGDIVGCPRSTARERRACPRADDSTARLPDVDMCASFIWLTRFGRG